MVAHLCFKFSTQLAICYDLEETCSLEDDLRNDTWVFTIQRISLRVQWLVKLWCLCQGDPTCSELISWKLDRREEVILSSSTWPTQERAAQSPRPKACNYTFIGFGETASFIWRIIQLVHRRRSADRSYLHGGLLHPTPGSNRLLPIHLWRPVDGVKVVCASARSGIHPFTPSLALGCFHELKSKAVRVWHWREREYPGPLPAGLDTISSSDTLRLCLPCNLFCLSIWWMSCLPALPHTLENEDSRTLLKELQKGRQDAFVFCKEGGFFHVHVCECVLLAPYNNVLTPCYVTHWLIKCEKLIAGKIEGHVQGI